MGLGMTDDLEFEHFLDKSIFLETQDVNWKTAKNVPKYEPKQHFPMLK